MILENLRRAALLGLLFLVLAGPSPEPSTPSPIHPMAQDLPGLGFAVTAGAAPGYVDERACALCHAALSESYRAKGMARAFRRPRQEIDIESFTAPPFAHGPSRQIFQMSRRGDHLVFRRWQNDARGQPINVFEQEVDWILGSGDHARTYLYRTEAGELFQLPLAWYSQARSWGMAPGFDRPDHEGVLRRVRRECVFCHASYPDVPAGADTYGAPQIFPRAMPEGIGCQRCHGPGALHVGLALGGIGDAGEIRESVFNPGRLPPARRDEVCMGCHLQPSVALPGLRRFGRGDFSFRPGEPLGDYLVQVDVEEEGREPSERFEINHHPYRLRQSRCFVESGGALSCLTCHDPHRKIPENERVAHYQAACRTCHSLPLPGHTDAMADCASCHMPKRRTEDVVHVVMTDHWIRRRPGGPELLAPRSETEPVLTGVRLLDPSPLGDLAEVYRASAVVRMASTAEAVDALGRRLDLSRTFVREPWLDQAQGLLRRRRYAEAEQALKAVLEKSPDDPQGQEWLALAKAGEGQGEEAIAVLLRLVDRHPDRPEAEYNLGRLLAARGRLPEAEAVLLRAVTTRPNLQVAWHHLGEVRASRGRVAEALPCWRRALEIDPTFTPSYLSLARALRGRGQPGDEAEALRWLRHGASAAARPEPVATALQEAQDER